MCTITDNSGGNLDQQQQRDGDDDNEIAAETTISRFDDDGGKIVLSSPSSLSVSALALSEECPASIVRPSILDRWPEDPPSYDTDSAGGIHKQPLCSLLSYLRRLYGNWTYSYMNIVLKKGAQQNRRKGGSAAHVGHQYLTSDDLYSVPRNMRSDRLVHDFQQYEDASRVSRPDWSSRRRLLWTLWRIAAPTYVPAGLCELLVVICGTALPLLVRKLLSVLEEHPDENITRLGLPWGLAISFVSILNGLGNHRHRHLALRTGVGLRAAIVNLIYSHVLHLSPEGKRHLTSGEISNLVAVDAQKLFEVTQEGHLIWALPLQIVLVTFFLYRVLGPSILVGIAVLVGFLPIINVITSKMMRVRSMRIRCSDKRVEIVSNMLQGIKVTKLNHYEDSYYNRIKLLRDEELKHLAVEMAFWGSTLLIMVSSPVLATAACFTTYVLLEPGTNLLTAANTFGVLLLFSALRFPINFAGRLIGKAAQALSAIRRIALFLDRPLRKDDVRVETEKTTAATEEGNGSTIDDDDTPLRLIKASFRIGEVGPVQVDDNGDDELSGTKNDMDSSSVGTAIAVSFTVAEFNFSIKKGEVLAVCGPVGSGKSTFINGIFDEAEALGDTRVLKRGQFSYAPQNPFILNESLRDNILFGLPYDEEWYNQVLDACALRPDIEQLGGSDLVQIGERGVTLSGGQRQRCSLARATYTRAACIVLDDPFSALDSGTGKQVFERLISSPDALLKDSAVLLVTHASHLISHRAVDKILLMVNGKNQFYGTWDELNNFQSSDEATKRAVEHINSQVRENTKESDSDEANEYDEKKDEQKLIGKQKKKKIMEVETREHGLSSMKTWLLWFQRAGGVRFMGLQAMFLTIDRFAYIVVEWFLARWTSGVYTPVVIAGIEFPPQTEGLSAQAQYLKVYAGIILVSVIATACRSEYAVTGGSRAAKNVFYTMLSSVLRAPMSYFETIPMGRILNRFTYDTDVIDVNLTQVMSTFIISCSWYIAGCIIQIAILPWSVLVLFPVSLMYWGLMLLYRMSGPDLQRIDALSRSPLQSMVSECLEGSTSIRIFHQDANFVRRFGDFANINSSALLNFVSAQRWLGVRMEFMGSAVVLVSTTLVVCMNETLGLEAGLAGMLILWSSNFTITLNFMVDTFSETGTSLLVEFLASVLVRIIILF